MRHSARLVCAAGLAITGPVVVAHAQAPFDHCYRALASAPDARSSARCFHEAGEAAGRRQDAETHLVRARRSHPGAGWLTFYLAESLARTRPAAAVDVYREAVREFSARTDANGEIEARVQTGWALFVSGQRDRAWAEAPAMLEFARRRGEPLLIARALMYEVWLILQSGETLGRGLRLAREAEAIVFPDGPYELKHRVLSSLGTIAFATGRYSQALSYYTNVVWLAQAQDDLANLARARYNVLTTRRRLVEQMPERAQLEPLKDAARELADTAARSRHPLFQASAHRSLGDLLAGEPATREEGVEHYRLALAFARRSGDAEEIATCLWALGRVLPADLASEAQDLVNEALRIAAESRSPTSIAYASRQQMRLAWRTGSASSAKATSMRALRTIEALRDLQGHDLQRAAVLSAWTRDHYWLAGKLLESARATGSEADLALAFSVIEQMRARALLELLSRRPQRTPDADLRAVTRRENVLRSISETQSRLLHPDLDDTSRKQAFAALERLEREEETLRAALIAARDPGSPGRPFAAIGDVQRALAPNEAFLSFAIGIDQDFYGEFGGGAWLIAVTNDRTKAFSVPDRTRLYPMVSIARGVIEYDAGGAARFGERLYQALLGEALRSLPRTIDRLIVVPDGPLHDLPLAALRSSSTSAPIGITHQIALVPSATVWLRWRERRAPATPQAVLVIADPTIPDGLKDEPAAKERGWSPEVARLGPLPNARVEGRAILSHVSRASRLLAGAAATETALKRSDFGSFGIVHFAAHALVDEAAPDRSAIVLTPSAAEDDGLLQAREIGDLALDERTVVLSACRSATGLVLGGEGVVGLSRAFFQAGARAVVGTLWPVRDDHAARFFDRFYRSLTRGRSIGQALAESRHDAIERGLPSSVWSSVVIVGDDTVVPFPGGTRSSARSLATAGVAGAVTALLVLVPLLIRKRRRHRTRCERFSAPCAQQADRYNGSARTDNAAAETMAFVQYFNSAMTRRIAERSGRPLPGEYADYAQADIDEVNGDDAVAILAALAEETLAFLRGLPEERLAGVRYAPGKWTMKDVVAHLIDDERIFAYRALCVARGETQALPGFDEELYAASAAGETRPWQDLLAEYTTVRAATLALLGSLSSSAWTRGGTVNGYSATARGLAFHIAGHELHHLRIVRERYLPLLA